MKKKVFTGCAENAGQLNGHRKRSSAFSFRRLCRVCLSSGASIAHLRYFIFLRITNAKLRRESSSRDDMAALTKNKVQIVRRWRERIELIPRESWESIRRRFLFRIEAMPMLFGRRGPKILFSQKYIATKERWRENMLIEDNRCSEFFFNSTISPKLEVYGYLKVDRNL